MQYTFCHTVSWYSFIIANLSIIRIFILFLSTINLIVKILLTNLINDKRNRDRYCNA